MLHIYGADYKEYERKLQTEIEPILNQLAKETNHPEIIWLNQFPTNDFWAPNTKSNADIFSEKIHQYNLILQRVFRYNTYDCICMSRQISPKLL